MTKPKVFDLVCFGQPIIDVLGVLPDDSLLTELGLTRAERRLITIEEWQQFTEALNARQVLLHTSTGGSCGNTMAMAVRSGLPSPGVVYFGVVGDDDLGAEFQRLFPFHGCTHRLRKVSGTTGRALVLVSPHDGERTMLMHLGVSGIQIPDIDEYLMAVEQSRAAHFTVYTMAGQPQEVLTVAAMELAHEHGGLVSLDAGDPGVLSHLRERVITEALPHVDILFLNQEEARVLSQGEATPRGAVEILRAYTRATIVVKRGAEGSVVFPPDGGMIEVPAVPTSVVDTTGAGDAYAGAFLASQLRGDTYERSARFASHVASRVVAQVGAVVSSLDLVYPVVW